MRLPNPENHMNYNFEEITYPSSDGKNTVYAEIYTPKLKTAKGIVQLSHGMTDHPGRYMSLIEHLTGEGYIFAGNHHLGHGRTAATEEDFGFFASKGGIDYILSDLHSFNKYLRNTYPALPLVLLGHSMGSFIARLYVCRHPHSMRGVIIHGTGGPNPLAPLGKLVARGVGLFRTERARSRLITSLAFGSYNRRFDKSEGSTAWLSRDTAAVAGKKDDPLASFTFTASAYRDLFDMLESSNKKAWYREYPKDMRTLIMSGDADPVGNYGKGVNYVYRHLMLEGCTDVSLKLYPDCRHELFNEINKDEIFADMTAWLRGVKA